MPTVFRVLYDRTAPGWRVELDGRERPIARTIARREAIELALKLGRSAKFAQVYVYRRNGSVETTHTFT